MGQVPLRVNLSPELLPMLSDLPTWLPLALADVCFFFLLGVHVSECSATIFEGAVAALQQLWHLRTLPNSQRPSVPTSSYASLSTSLPEAARSCILAASKCTPS